ncbi:MAG: diguanylate cyclase [Candidatus Marinarcus sp.]|uniref:sensor domain-containing diguanylate cyclase n=1 Tax=Candidatus Marinarcus sp. TaxID=3100987 RepID=UPI003B00DE0C
MNIKHIKLNIIFFIITYIFMITFLCLISYNFFINDFLKLESKQNQSNVNTLLLTINQNIQSISQKANDYSKWDDTYQFMNDANKNYIFINFREGSNTLEDLNLNFIIYSTLDNQTVYSKYKSKELKDNQKDFEKSLFQHFKNSKAENTLFNYKEHYIYISKSEISDSNGEKRANGYLYMGEIVNPTQLTKITKIFDKIYLSNRYENKNYDLTFHLSDLKNIKVKTSFEETKLKNNIQLFDNQNRYIFSIIAENERDIVKNGKKTILSFNVLITLFLFIILIIIFNNQKTLEKQNFLLESKVKRRTNQLTRSLKKLQTKNAELYTLANKDHLTKINNRRNYFIESEKLLEVALENKTPLCVLIIDIDNFKQINDKYGHASGDKILISFCTIVNEIIDDDVIFGRIGGEEFCLTFGNTTLEEATIIGEKIRNRCENSTLHINNQTITFTISLGLSNQKDFKCIDEILQHADELLYDAKAEGRNRLIRTSIHK